jgi:hypothetical protein
MLWWSAMTKGSITRVENREKNATMTGAETIRLPSSLTQVNAAPPPMPHKMPMR